jgi:DNA-binding protein HU-beta
MKKQELITQISDELSLSKKLTGEVIDTTFGEIGNILNDNGKFAYPGFGTFVVKNRAARVGINPKTKAKINIPASNTVSFKISSTWKDTLNNK